MTDPITRTQLVNASTDADNIANAINGPASGDGSSFVNRVGNTLKSWSRLYAEVTASVASIIAASTGDIVGTNLIFAKNYASLDLADAVAVAGGYVLVVDKSFTLSASTSLSAKEVWFASGVVTLGDFDLTFNSCGIQATGVQIFVQSGAGKTRGAISSHAVIAKWWGAVGDGSTNDAAAINVALVAGAEFELPVLGLGLTYICNSQVTFDVSKTSLFPDGATIDFSGIGAGVPGAVLLTTSWTDANTIIAAHIRHPLQNVFLIGPHNSGTLAANPTDAVGFVATTISSTKFIPGTVIRNLSATGFTSMFNLSDGTFISTFENCAFLGDFGRSAGHMFRTTGGSNAGERYTIINPACINAEGLILDQAQNDAAEFYVYSPSIDGGNRIVAGGNPLSPDASHQARVVIFGGHYEGATVGGRLAWPGTNGMCLIYGMWFVFQSAIAATPFKSDSVVRQGGLILRDISIVDVTLGGLPAEFLCDGSGRFVATGVTMGGASFVPPFSSASNKIPLFNMVNSTDFTGIWSRSGTTAYDVTTQPSGATGVAKITGNGAISLDLLCDPGQSCDFQALLKTSGIVSNGATITLKVEYRSPAGDSLASSRNDIGADFSIFSVNRVYTNAIAPPGTTVARVSVTLASASGSPICYVGRPAAVVD